MAVRRTDLASLIQSRVFGGFWWWGCWWSSCCSCGLPRSPPEVLSSPPGAEITLDRNTHAAEPMALENFRNRCVWWLCPSFSFPSLRVLVSLFPTPWALDLGYKLVSCSPSLASALSELRGGGGGRGASCLREEESARMGRGERRELLRSSARSSLVHSERSDTLCWSAVAKIHLVRECWRRKKKKSIHVQGKR